MPLTTYAFHTTLTTLLFMALFIRHAKPSSQSNKKTIMKLTVSAVQLEKRSKKKENVQRIELFDSF